MASDASTLARDKISSKKNPNVIKITYADTNLHIFSSFFHSATLRRISSYRNLRILLHIFLFISFLSIFTRINTFAKNNADWFGQRCSFFFLLYVFLSFFFYWNMIEVMWLIYYKICYFNRKINHPTKIMRPPS